MHLTISAYRTDRTTRRLAFRKLVARVYKVLWIE